MDVKQRIIQRLDELIAEAEAILGTSTDGRTFEGLDAARVWRISCLPFIRQLAAADSPYYSEFEKQSMRGYSDQLRTALAVLIRLRNDYSRGYLRDLQELAAGEVFTDFLDMADHLQSKTYHVAAASIAGAVLEDSLRRLHLKHAGQWQGDSSINKLNDGLKKADVYRQAVWRQIQVWGDIRNKADHGDFNEVDPGQVKQMISGIRDFIARHEG